MKRNRIIYAICILIVVLLGLASRANFSVLPQFVKDYAGDTLWALVAFLLTAFVFPRFSIARVAFVAAVFSLFIELSQLYQAPWIDAVRRIRIGGLILGFGFLWSDLVCYAVGILIGVLLEIGGLARVVSEKKQK